MSANSAAAEVLANAPFKLTRRVGCNSPCGLQDVKGYVRKVSGYRFVDVNSSCISSEGEIEENRRAESKQKIIMEFGDD